MRNVYLGYSVPGKAGEALAKDFADNPTRFIREMQRWEEKVLESQGKRTGGPGQSLAMPASAEPSNESMEEILDLGVVRRLRRHRAATEAWWDREGMG